MEHTSGPSRATAVLGTVLLAIVGLGLTSTAPLAADGAEAKPPSHHFDTDRQQWLIDTDGDGAVDLTEEIAGTDPFDTKDSPATRAAQISATDQEGPRPGASPQKVGFPFPVCRTSMRQPGPRLCIDVFAQRAETNQDASWRCRERFARVCTYEDLYYLYRVSSFDQSYNPNGKWIGGMQSDNNAMCGNRDVTFNEDPDTFDFEGNCHKWAGGGRQYWCCHDRE